MLKLFKWTFWVITLFVFAIEIHRFSYMHGGFGNMMYLFEQEFVRTAQLMLHHGTTAMQQEAENYMGELE